MKQSSTQGSTLVEVLVAIAIIDIFLTASSVSILNSQFLASYAKHKIQARYVAQQILEQQRRLTYVNIVSVASAAVTLDSKGTYNTTSDDFLGNAIVSVTTIDTYRKKVQVQVNWQEQILSGKVTMREYYATDIANDPIPN
ncbi:MAG: type II secretion system protein [Candidatus Omnitrophica bacterium]|nr:type II secretion system protein [Candidatus Omnitrophota bacterium]